jgi:rhodanese-related sulfurtransferase
MTIIVATLLVAAGAAPASVFETTLGEAGQKTAEISFAEMKDVLAGNKAAVFDARPAKEFALGHIPGALNVAPKPGVPMSQYVSDVHEIDRVLKGDKAKPIVLYCNGPFCGKSKRLSAELLQAGFTSVRRFQLGMPVWRALGGVQQIELEGARSVLDNDRTAWLLDARGTSDVPGARGLAAADVGKAKDDGRLPMEDHHTRIVVVGANEAQARALAEAVAREAFDNVTYFAGDPASLRGSPGAAKTADR